MGSSDFRLMTHIPGPECDQYYRADLSEVGQEVDIFFNIRSWNGAIDIDIAQLVENSPSTDKFLYPVFNAT